jgi:hypothetical protein
MAPSRRVCVLSAGSLLLAGSLFLAPAPGLGRKAATADGRSNAIERLRRDVTFLASDECEGRGITTKGINLAADYIAGEFKKAGLKPGGPDGSYFQPFTIKGPGKLEGPNRVVLTGPKGQTLDLKEGEQFRVMGLSGSGKVTAPVVFAGYGVTATGIAYDDFAKVKVAGKVVVFVRKTPHFGDTKHPFDGDLAEHHAALITKIVNADLHRAAAVLFVNDHDLPGGKDRLMSFGYTARGGGAGSAPAVHVRRAVVNDMLRSSLGTTLSKIESAIEHDLQPRSGPLKGWTATVEVHVRRPLVPAKNVVGVLDGSGPLANQTVIVGAHYDHLGYGGAGSLARSRRKQIHPGADDNASGTTVLMELARRLSAQADGRQQAAGRRRLVFIAFSGEETGLLGSEYYCKHPLFRLSGTVAMINLDMVGRLHREDGRDWLMVQGTGTSKGFDALIDRLNQPFGFRLSKVAGGLGPSDHSSFYQSKVPVLFFFTGTHKDYHRPSDTADKLNVPGMTRVADLVERLARELATTTERPRYVYVKGRFSAGRRYAGPTLGIMPGNYNDEEGGLLIAGVREGGPAEKAGLREGDRIVSLAGQPVKNIQTYMVILRTQKKGQPVEVGVLRNGKKLLLKAFPK